MKNFLETISKDNIRNTIENSGTTYYNTDLFYKKAQITLAVNTKGQHLVLTVSHKTGKLNEDGKEVFDKDIMSVYKESVIEDILKEAGPYEEFSIDTVSRFATKAR